MLLRRAIVSAAVTTAVWTVLLLLGPSATSRAQRPPDSSQPRFRIGYRLSATDSASHLFGIEIDVGNLGGGTLRLQMPVWSPGRYARFDFARNVQEFSAVGSDARPVRFDRENGSLWRLYPGGVRNVTIRYRVFANSLSGTFSVLDTAHANWNGASLFMYVVDHKPDPVTLHIDRPAHWHIINGDARVVDQTDYQFENYDRLIDTPTEVSPHLLVDSFTVDNRLYRTVVHHNGAPPPAARARFIADVKKLVRYENGVVGAPPLSMYTFLFHIGYAGGDGMEHLYSTQIIDRRPWTDSLAVLPGIGTAAHEYFHVWNVKRVRPLALGPFDYAHEQYQPSLWVAEGWTQYYGQAALHRAGITPLAEFYESMARLIQGNLTAPGRREVSARIASFEAPFWDGDTGGQPDNGRNAFFSYYTKGAGIASYLDLLIRSRSNNSKSLDDAFRRLKAESWAAPDASYYLHGRGYTEADVERAVSDAVGMDMHAWFERYVAGTEDLPFDDVVASAGLHLVRGDRWALEELPNASPIQLRVREGWVTGRTTP